MRRKQNFQTIAWFRDLQQRDRLDLEPPYQRRSVWNQSFKDYFIDTILLNYPAPAIFLYEDISADGIATYHVVDGKQRLTAIFEFVDGRYAVAETAQRVELRGLYFQDLLDDVKKEFWSFQFSVEYLPNVDENVIGNIFDRINRNMARLTAQELRHAKFDGVFIGESERLAEWMFSQMPQNFPNIASTSRKQMKDVEFVAELLLLLETGPRGYSTATLDAAFAERDLDWEAEHEVVARFTETVEYIATLMTVDGGDAIRGTRLKNQTDYYSMFGALAELRESGDLPDEQLSSRRLLRFAERVEDEEERANNASFAEYYEAARSASNDSTQRKTRIDTVKRVLSGDIGVL